MKRGLHILLPSSAVAIMIGLWLAGDPPVEKVTHPPDLVSQKAAPSATEAPSSKPAQISETKTTRWIRFHLSAMLKQAIATDNWEALQAAMAEQMRLHPQELINSLLDAQAQLHEYHTTLVMMALGCCPLSEIDPIAEILGLRSKDQGLLQSSLTNLLASATRRQPDLLPTLLSHAAKAPDSTRCMTSLGQEVVNAKGVQGFTHFARQVSHLENAPAIVAGAVSHLAAKEPSNVLKTLSSFSTTRMREEALLASVPVLMALGKTEEINAWLAVPANAKSIGPNTREELAVLLTTPLKTTPDEPRLNIPVAARNDVEMQASRQ